MPRQTPEDVARHVVRGTASLAWTHPARIRFLAPAEVLDPPELRVLLRELVARYAAAAAEP